MDFDEKLFTLFGIPCAFLEFYISRKKFSSTVEKSASKDAGSFKSIWAVICASQTFAYICVRRNFGPKIIGDGPLKFYVWVPMSIFLYLMGHRIRHQSIEQLGRWFTTIVRTNSQQELIQTGWYSKMRHPSYTGCLMYFLGLSLLSNNWFVLFGAMIPISCVFRYRIYIEEKALSQHFREKYDEYRRKVPNMIFPRLFK